MISAALAIINDDNQRNELSEIYRQNARIFFAIAMAKLHNKQDAEEAVQEAFLSIARSPDCLFNIPSERRVAYINVIIRNHAFRIWNYKNKLKDIEIELKEEMAYGAPLVEEKVCVECSCEEIYRFIDKLPESLRSALALKLNFGLRYSDIARILGMTEEGVKSRIKKANAMILEFLEGEKNGKVLYD